MPALCTGGMLLHPCECGHAEEPEHEDECGHEADCAIDPCGAVGIRPQQRSGDMPDCESWGCAPVLMIVACDSTVLLPLIWSSPPFHFYQPPGILNALASTILLI
jgi:hypothetical protein